MAVLVTLLTVWQVYARLEMNERLWPQILETKVRKLEQLVRLKDAKIQTLIQKLQQVRGRSTSTHVSAFVAEKSLCSASAKRAGPIAGSAAVAVACADPGFACRRPCAHRRESACRSGGPKAGPVFRRNWRVFRLSTGGWIPGGGTTETTTT